MRALTLLFLLSSSYALTTQQANQTIHAYWEAAMAGDAAKFHSFLAPNVVVVTNGEEEDVPWGDESFVKNLFSKVRYLRMKMVSPVGVETSTNSFFCNYQWTIIILATGQDIEMGLWSVRMKIDAAGKITHITNIAEAAPLENLAVALATKDLRETAQGFLNAMNAVSVSSLMKLMSRDFGFTLNGEEVEEWADNLPGLFYNAKWNVKLLEYATAGPDDALATVEVTVTSKEDPELEPVTSLQAWHFYYNATPPATIESIVAIQDSLAAYESDLIVHPNKIRRS